MKQFKTINLYDTFLDEWSENWVKEYKSLGIYIPDEIFLNPNITIKIIKLKLINSWYDNYWYFNFNKNISLKIIKDNPKLNWYNRYNNVITNRNITFNMIMKNKEIDWHPEYIGTNRKYNHKKY